MRRLRNLTILFCLAGSLVFFGCEEPQMAIDFDKATFYSKWAAWEAQGIVDYSVTQYWSPDDPLRVIVKDNVVIRAEASLPDINMSAIKTVSELYAWVYAEYKRLTANRGGGTIRITYNEDFNFPESIRIFRSNPLPNVVGLPPPIFVDLADFEQFTTVPDPMLTRGRWVTILNEIYNDPFFDGTLDLSNYRRSLAATCGGLRRDGIFDPMPGFNKTAKERITTLILPDEAVFLADRVNLMSSFIDFVNLKELTGRNITRIDDFTFFRFYSLVSVDFPKVTYIGENAFSYSSLISVNFPKAEIIGTRAFWDCTSLVSVNFPKAETIGDSAFSGCTSLVSVNFPKAKTIGAGAFSGCINLGIVNIPEVTSISNVVFSQRDDFTGIVNLTITMGTTAPSLGLMMFIGSNGTVTVRIPAGATGYTDIWANAFRDGNNNINLVIEYLQ